MPAAVFGIAATFVVLLMLLSETLVLYANLARSILRQRNERDARQIAMDAMAASIAHEIRQPLASIVLNGETALFCLTGATSNLDVARDALRCVVDDSHRASAVIKRHPVDVPEGSSRENSAGYKRAGS